MLRLALVRRNLRSDRQHHRRSRRLPRLGACMRLPLPESSRKHCRSVFVDHSQRHSDFHSLDCPANSAEQVQEPTTDSSPVPILEHLAPALNLQDLEFPLLQGVHLNRNLMRQDMNLRDMNLPQRARRTFQDTPIRHRLNLSVLATEVDRADLSATARRLHRPVPISP